MKFQLPSEKFEKIDNFISIYCYISLSFKDTTKSDKYFYTCLLDYSLFPIANEYRLIKFFCHIYPNLINCANFQNQAKNGLCNLKSN